MEPLESDIEYISDAPRPATAESRLSMLYIFPVLGVLLILVFIGALIFQWNLSALVDNLVVLMVVLFFIFTAIVFWGSSLRARKS